MGIFKELSDMFRYSHNFDDYKRHKAVEVQYPQHNRMAESQRSWKSLKLGQGQEAVLAALGLPDYTRDHEWNRPWDLEWTYENWEGSVVHGTVVFKKGKVSGFSYGSPIVCNKGMCDVCGCGKEDWSKLKLGMSELAVIKLVSQPDTIDTPSVTPPPPSSPLDSLDVLWGYGLWGERDSPIIDASVAFKKDRVVGIYCDRDGQDFRAVGIYEGFRKGQPLWKSLRLGMSGEEVLALLGLPRDVVAHEDGRADWDISWCYSDPDRDRVAFRNKKVVGFSYAGYKGVVTAGVWADGENAEQQYLYVGSKSGRVFHRLGKGCSRNIKSENIVSFKSKKDALKKGYEPCIRCTLDRT